nr:hypothetical protein [Tanacetum cinerariifolium]
MKEALWAGTKLDLLHKDTLRRRELIMTKVFAPVARIEAIRLFLAYASFMGFLVYQMDVKSAFLYGTIEEEVYVCQPLGFRDPDYPVQVYKEVKKDDILLVQIFVDDIIFGSTNKNLCKAFEKLMKDKFKMNSMGELTFFFWSSNGKSTSTPIDTEKPLLKDADGEDVDVHTYRLMIGSLMYLTSSRPDIMFAVALSGMESLKRMLHVTKILSAGYLTTPQMVFNSPCCSNEELASPKANDSWYSTHHVALMKSWLVQKQMTLVDEKVGIGVSAVDLQVYAVRLILPLLVQKFLLFDKKKVIITEATIRDALCLDDAEGIECLPNDEIFTELARMGYEKPSTKLTFYKAFFSSQCKFLIHTILQCMSTKRTSWNEFSSSMASAVICLST